MRVSVSAGANEISRYHTFISTQPHPQTALEHTVRNTHTHTDTHTHSHKHTLSNTTNAQIPMIGKRNTTRDRENLSAK